MPQPRGLCRSTLREALRQNTSQAHAFDASLQTALSQASLGTAAELTRVVHDCCVASFPPRTATKAPRAWQTPESRLEVKHLWDKYRALQSHYRTHRTLRLQHRDRGLLAYALEAFRRHAAFRKCQTTLKQRGKATRKAIIDEVLQEAAKAASAGDMHALYSRI